MVQHMVNNLVPWVQALYSCNVLLFGYLDQGWLICENIAQIVLLIL